MRYTSFLKFFLLLGTMFVVAGGYLYSRTADFLAVAQEATGTVVALERMRSGSMSLKPVVEWTDHVGSRRVLYSNAGSSPPRFFVGEEVTVLFDPDDPKYPVNARIRSTMQLWGASLIMTILGLAFILVASLSWYVLSKGGVVYFDVGRATSPPSDAD